MELKDVLVHDVDLEAGLFRALQTRRSALNGTVQPLMSIIMIMANMSCMIDCVTLDDVCALVGIQIAETFARIPTISFPMTVTTAFFSASLSLRNVGALPAGLRRGIAFALLSNKYAQCQAQAQFKFRDFQNARDLCYNIKLYKTAYSFSVSSSQFLALFWIEGGICLPYKFFGGSPQPPELLV